MPFARSHNLTEYPVREGGSLVTSTRSKSHEDASGHGVHNLGYRSWNGRLSPGWTRWIVIASVGFVRPWKSMWLRRMLLLAWLPTLWFGLGFFFWEQAVLYPDWRQTLTPFLR